MCIVCCDHCPHCPLTQTLNPNRYLRWEVSVVSVGLGFLKKVIVRAEFRTRKIHHSNNAICKKRQVLHFSRIAACCSVLQRVAACDSMLQCVAVCCKDEFLEKCIKWCISHSRNATHCNTLQHAATRCNTLQHSATLCNTLSNSATHC